MVYSNEGAYDGSNQPGALPATLAWLQSKDYPLNYAFADYESPAANQNCLAMVALVRSSPDPQINQAMIGNYGNYPGRYNLARDGARPDSSRHLLSQ